MAMQVIESRQYKDLLKQMQGQRTGAVDVEREGIPPDHAWRGPAQQPERVSAVSAGDPAMEVKLPEVEVLLVLLKFNLLQYLIKPISDVILELDTL